MSSASEPFTGFGAGYHPACTRQQPTRKGLDSRHFPKRGRVTRWRTSIYLYINLSIYLYIYRSDESSSSSPPAVVRDCAGSICSYRSNPRKHGLDRLDRMAPTRQHELDHTDHTDHTDEGLRSALTGQRSRSGNQRSV